jgi:hypothetical protein
MLEQKELDLEVYTKTGKLRKRKKKKVREYFNQETENAIIAYINSDSKEERDFLFSTKINESIHKLAENIIHTFKFYYTELNNVEDLKHEVVVFLLSKLHRYNKDKGKAYSYLGTIAKRYLIVYNENNYKNLKNRADLQDVDEDRKVMSDIFAEDSKKEVSEVVASYINYVEKNIDKFFPSASDQSIVISVMQIFKNVDSLEVFNKQQFYFYIKEITGQNTLSVTKCVKELKKIYKKVLRELYLSGELETD